MNKNKKMNTDVIEKQMIDQMMGLLKHIYSNKSSDEYKSHGDITKTAEYSNVEKMVADLRTLKKFPSVDAADIKNLFNTLHRPIFSKMVTEYINEPNERNTVFTAVYTVGYRVLLGELSRIYSSTVSTEKGIEYRPSKISKRETLIPFIRAYNVSLEKRIDDCIRASFKERQHVKESVEPFQENFITAMFNIREKLERMTTKIHRFVTGPLTRAIEEDIISVGYILHMFERTKYVDTDTDVDSDGKHTSSRTIEKTYENENISKIALLHNLGMKIKTKEKKAAKFTEEELKDLDELINLSDKLYSVILSIIISNGRDTAGDSKCLNIICDIAPRLDKLCQSFKKERPDNDDVAIQEGVDDMIIKGYKKIYRFGLKHGKHFTDFFIIKPIKKIFMGMKNINPIYFMNTVLTSAYERKVDSFDKVQQMYIATKLAYDDYLRIPEAQRNKKVESKYQKNIDKYNIKMQNIWATIQHYDQRAEAEASPDFYYDNMSDTDEEDVDDINEEHDDSSNEEESDNTNSGFDF